MPDFRDGRAHRASSRDDAEHGGGEAAGGVPAEALVQQGEPDALRRLQCLPHIVPGFFADPNLACIYACARWLRKITPRAV